MCCVHSDIAVLSLLFPSLSYQGVKNYKMDTVITVYVDLHKNFVQLECTTTLHIAVKTEHVCRTRQFLHALHRALLYVSEFHSVVSCLKWVFHDNRSIFSHITRYSGHLWLF